MEGQVPASSLPDTSNPWGDFFDNTKDFGEPQDIPQPQLQRQLTPEQIQLMKQAALQQAIQQRVAVQAPAPQPSYIPQEPQPLEQPRIVYVRRNFTVAELILVLALAVGCVTGIQLIWSGVVNVLPRIEIRYAK